MGENNVVGMQFEKAEKVTVIVWVGGGPFNNLKLSLFLGIQTKGIDLFKSKWRKERSAI